MYFCEKYLAFTGSVTEICSKEVIQVLVNDLNCPFDLYHHRLREGRLQVTRCCMGVSSGLVSPMSQGPLLHYGEFTV